MAEVVAEAEDGSDVFCVLSLPSFLLPGEINALGFGPRSARSDPPNLKHLSRLAPTVSLRYQNS